MEVYSIGVLITGESGAGKSELALELITRGHRLVADDAPEFTQIAPDVLDGTCPEMLQDLLEVRGLGILNVREMFGDTAVKRNKYLRLIVHLRAPRMPQAEPDAREAPVRRSTGYRTRARCRDPADHACRWRRAATSRCWSKPRCASTCCKQQGHRRRRRPSSIARRTRCAARRRGGRDRATTPTPRDDARRLDRASAACLARARPWRCARSRISTTTASTTCRPA